MRYISDLNSIDFLEVTSLVTDAGLAFLGVGEARVALVGVTFAFTGAVTTLAVGVTSCNTKR